MSVYELGFAPTNTLANTAQWEFVAGSGEPANILEIGYSRTATAGEQWLIGRPGNTPAGGTPITASNPTDLKDSASTSSGGIVLSGWTTAPTAPSGGKLFTTQRWQTANQQGMLFSWWKGLLIVDPSRNNGLVMWASDAPAAGTRVWIKWEE